LLAPDRGISSGATMIPLIVAELLDTLAHSFPI
jgi:hypothetical protein